jgi:hypothetical protein
LLPIHFISLGKFLRFQVAKLLKSVENPAVKGPAPMDQYMSLECVLMTEFAGEPFLRLWWEILAPLVNANMVFIIVIFLVAILINFLESLLVIRFA